MCFDCQIHINMIKLIFVLLVTNVCSTVVSNEIDYEKDEAVKNLRDYLRIKSVHPNVNYDESISFLKRQAESLGIPYKVYEVIPKKPILVMTWAGTQPELTSVLLNSHMDVVPVFEKSWAHPPFEAYMDDNGTIFARGVQDMKSVGIQYIETIKRLKAAGIKLKRTIHLSFVPDEEIGGHEGLDVFSKSEQIKDLNIGFSLDEGMTSSNSDYAVFYAERSIWHIDIICPGKSGHGSLLHENTAGEKIRYIINKFLDLRAENKKKLNSDSSLTVGDVTTINLTKLKGGIQENVVPEVLSVTFDIRLDLSINHTEFENMIKRWCEEAGEGVHYTFTQKEPYVEPTKIDDSNAYWVAFKTTAQELGLPIKTRVFPGGTDSRYLRALGIPALGFTPIINTPIQLHEHNESLNALTFLNGIRIYEKVIPALANV